MGAQKLAHATISFAQSCSSSPASWAPKGRCARSSVPRNWGTNIAFLASTTANGMGPSLAVEGATTREVFEAYLERFLMPSLGPGQVVVMDNLSVHKGRRVRS
jgi:hypothetical protein